MRYSPEELQQATDCLAKELGVDVPQARSFGFHLLWTCSILRVFIRDMSRLDDDGVTQLSFSDGSTHPIDGYDGSMRQASLWARWTQRASGWSYLHKADIDHTTDWLWAAASGAHHWLSDLDDKGLPKKLMKCGTIQALAAEADKMGRKRNSDGGLKWKPLASDEVQLIADLGSGLYLHRLLSARALDQESRRMDHCVGDGAYDDTLRDPNHLILSVRDSGGSPLATAEVVNGIVEQIVGPGNLAAPRHVVAAFERYRDSIGWRDEYDIWATQRVRSMEYGVLRSTLGWPNNRADYERFLESSESEQEADLVLMRAAAELLPLVEPRERVDWRPEVEEFEPDPSSFHIVLDDDGEPAEVDVDNDALDPFRPR